MIKTLLLIPTIILISNMFFFTSLPQANASDEKEEFFNDLHTVIKDNRDELVKILTKVNSHYGANYEIDQVLKTLKDIKFHQLENLNGIKGVDNVAVYGARNVPLYTIFEHILLPATVAKNIWFRVPSVSKDAYMQLFDKIKTLLPKHDFSNIHMLDDIHYEHFLKTHVLGLNKKGNAKDIKSKPADVVIFVGSPETAKGIQEKIAEKINEINGSIDNKKDELLKKISNLTDQISQLPTNIEDKKEKHNNELKKNRLNIQLTKFQKDLEKTQNGRIENFKQLFLKFGNGLNPIIVTETADNNLDRALQAFKRSVLINNAQDCTAPKFSAVHAKFFDKFVGELENIFKEMKLHYGELDDPKASYSHMTYTQKDKFKDLKEFREKYKQYLKNQDAILDENTLRIDPHLFVFPYQMFTQVKLKDYFAPFFIVFKYSNDQELKSIAIDERLRKQSMFASIFGNSASKDEFYRRKWFQDNYMVTLINLDVYDEESGNIPFGGYGTDGSALTLSSVKSNGQLKSFDMYRPLQFSKDSREFFHAQKTTKDTDTKTETDLINKRGEAVIKMSDRFSTEEKRKQILNDMITNSTDKNYIKNITTILGRSSETADWKQIKLPQQTLRLHGIKYLQEAIKKQGLYTLVDCFSYKISKKELENFFGTQVICLEDHIYSRNSNFTSTGVVLHPSYVGQETSRLNTYRGAINPHLQYGVLSSILSDRIQEYNAATAIWPGIMPYSLTFDDLMKKQSQSQGQNGEDHFRKINEINQQIDLLISECKKSNKANNQTNYSIIEKRLQDKLKDLLTNFFTTVQKEIPQGAYIKNYGESTTGDLGIQITSFHYNLDNLVGQYLHRLDTTLYKFSKCKHMESSKGRVFDNSMNSSYYETGSKFIHKLLTKPANILLQERVKLSKTPLGFIREVRVDFLDGEPVNARARYTHEYSREDEIVAQKVLTEFFNRAPEQFKLLSGGADVARMEDGTWVIIELNSGACSGSTTTSIYPIEANKFISNLKGENTPLINTLETLYSKSLDEQRKFLSSIDRKEEVWTKRSIQDISLAEYARWFRDRYLDDWRTNQKRTKENAKESADETLDKIKKLFEGLGTPLSRDLPLLIRGAEDYLKGKLAEE
ncbi:MAG: aldehyde dehydrogenase family protein [Oligoflexia bacterium]|nr:aldehyde dehydrogenase family protein [Oligoflexia bacterium]